MPNLCSIQGDHHMMVQAAHVREIEYLCRVAQIAPRLREPSHGADNQVDDEQHQNAHEPPRVVHVEQVQGLVELQLVRIDVVEILMRDISLRNHRSEYGGNGQCDKQKYGEAERGEEILHLAPKLLVRHAHLFRMYCVFTNTNELSFQGERKWRGKLRGCTDEGSKCIDVGQG